MSDVENEFDVVPNRMIEMRAAEFVERRDCADWTEADEAKFETWLNEAPTNRVAFLRLNASWKRTERLAALRAPEFGKPAAATVARPANARRFLPIVAACGFALLSGGLFTAYLATPGYDTYATTVGGRETLKLHDGSKIELNTDTMVRIAQTPHQRLVRLEHGEAYFDVHHDEKRPFVVISDVGRIVDLGTKFSVQSSAEHLKVSLLEGRIRFELRICPAAHGKPNYCPVTLSSALLDRLRGRKNLLAI